MSQGGRLGPWQMCVGDDFSKVGSRRFVDHTAANL